MSLDSARLSFNKQETRHLLESVRQAAQTRQLGDLLIFLYLLVFVRQWFWIIDNNILAWSLTTVVAVGIWCGYLATRQIRRVTLDKSFYLVVVLPLLVGYLTRAAFPDTSFDVLNYHLLQGERTLRGPLFQSGDFFHSVPFNPAADTLTALTRWFLGFRLGTVINLLVSIWTAQIIDQILRRFLQHNWFRSVCVLLIVLTENVLFEISTYMVDLLMLPLLFQATLLALRTDDAEAPVIHFVHIALLLGAAVALKLTALSAALPIVALSLAPAATRCSARHLIVIGSSMALAFIALFAPFSIYIFRLTGNPIFPVANGFFNSPYWPTHGGWDNRWGPHGFLESLIWPLVSWAKPERYSELALSSGRMSLGFFVALLGLLLLWRDTLVRKLCLLLIASSLLWSVLALGYSRYGLYQDLLAGIVIVAVAVRIPGSARFSLRTAFALILFLALAVQTLFACSYGLRTDWSGRSNVVKDPSAWVRESQLMLRDRSLSSFLKPNDKAIVEKVQVWFETAPRSTGFEVLLHARAPIIAMRQPEFFLTRDSWREFISRVKATTAQGMFSLCLRNEVEQAKQVVRERGLEVRNVTSVEIPFFSSSDSAAMSLIEVGVPQEPHARELFELGWMKGAFATQDYREQIVALNAPTRMRAGEKIEIQFKVTNLGSATWPAVGTKDFRYQINMGNHWIKDGVESEDSRALMAADLPPQGETDIKMLVTAPAKPGDYKLEIDMVHEGVTWFRDRGARPLSLPVTVEP